MIWRATAPPPNQSSLPDRPSSVNPRPQRVRSFRTKHQPPTQLEPGAVQVNDGLEVSALHNLVAQSGGSLVMVGYTNLKSWLSSGVRLMLEPGG
jgi:hypothetical protein